MKNSRQPPSKSYFTLMLAAACLFGAAPAAALTGSDTAPGDACTAGEEKQARLVADADGDERGVVLVCDGSNWVAELPTFTGACSDDVPIVYDADTGGLACGVPDTIDPIWVTPAGTIATTDVNLAISEVVAASDERGTPTYQKVSGASWLSVATNGTISGKAPAAGGTYSVAVRATDGAGNTADRSFDIVVNSGAGPSGCENPGDICADYMIYVGKSPDGDVDYFTTQANLAGSYAFNDQTTNWLDSTIGNCSNVESACRTGESNTNALMLADSATTTGGIDPHNAALACYCLGEAHENAPDGLVPSECSGDPVGTNGENGYGYDDWYLPSIAELDVMYLNLVSPGDADNPTFQDGVGSGEGASDAANDGPAAGSFGTGILWSSSEMNAVNGWPISFHNGQYYIINTNKRYRYGARCVRK